MSQTGGRPQSDLMLEIWKKFNRNSKFETKEIWNKNSWQQVKLEMYKVKL